MKFSMSVVSGVCFVLMCLNAALADSVAAQGRAKDADSSKIESMIAAACAPGGSRLVTLKSNPADRDGTWFISRAILLPDDFTLVVDGCRVQLAPGTRDNIIRNAGAAGLRDVTPNRGIKVLGRNGAVLCGGKSNHYAPNISGDRNGWTAMGILFAKVTGYEISGFAIEETQCWAISQEACSFGWVHDIEFRNSNIMRNQDGVDVRKGCRDIVIENITGVCGDDVVALTALRRPEGTSRAQGKVDCEITGSWPTPNDDIFNITVRNIRAKCAGGHGLIRLLVQDGIKMHHVTVSNIVHTAGEGDVLSHAAIRIGDERFWSILKCRLGDMHDITVSDVSSRARSGILISGPLSDSSVTGITVPQGTPKYKITSRIENVRLDKER